MQLSRTLLGAASALAVFAFAGSAQATVCSLTDISPTAADCAGFYDGNLLSGSPAGISAQTAALALLGFSWDGNFNAVEKLSPLNGSHTVDFSTLLQGTSFIGVHFGNGTGGPGNATAFYKLDAGTGLDVITLAYNASSDAVLYSTSPIPEPETYALLLAGLGVVGFMARRRQQQA